MSKKRKVGMILKKPCTKDFVQFFRDLPGIFCGSARELAHFPNMVGAGMLLAISIVLSTFVTITITPTLNWESPIWPRLCWV